MSYPRPLSPHLQIYKPQLTSVLSIAHRATGVALALGAVPLVYFFFSVSQGVEAYERMMTLYTGAFGLFCLFGWTFCFFYHLSNGIRHLVWDAGYGYELKHVYLSGWIVVGASLVLTLLSWLLGLTCMGECAI